MKVASICRYKGVFMNIKDAVNSGIFDNGDVISVGRDTYVYTQGSFEKIGEVGYEEIADNIADDGRSLIKLKCSSCGAPLMISKYSSEIKCEYCGTTYCRK